MKQMQKKSLMLELKKLKLDLSLDVKPKVESVENVMVVT